MLLNAFSVAENLRPLLYKKWLQKENRTMLVKLDTDKTVQKEKKGKTLIQIRTTNVKQNHFS